METNATELYRKYRPETFNDVVGQNEALKALADMGKRGKIPHALLLTGPSGCGKTTLARILAKKLKCSSSDFVEINGADFRGIDTIRDIRRQMSAAPLGGPCRIWLIDECHQQTGPSQDSFLKVLEDTPSHVYFMLATTDPQKLKKTIVTRCTEIRCKPISKGDLQKVVKRVCELEGVEVDSTVQEKIAEAADGSARKSLVILHAVIGLKTVEEQIAAIESADVKQQAIRIAQLLIKPSTKWPELAKVLAAVEEDPETLRYMVLGYCRTVLLKSGDPRAAMIMEQFRDNFYDSKASGLALACWNVLN